MPWYTLATAITIRSEQDLQNLILMLAPQNLNKL